MRSELTRLGGRPAPPGRPPAPRPHRSCGSVGHDWRRCLHCEMVDTYRDRRESYLDAVEVVDPGGDPVLPCVTFTWWLTEQVPRR